jgi:hypothetical protein
MRELQFRGCYQILTLTSEDVLQVSDVEVVIRSIKTKGFSRSAGFIALVESRLGAGMAWSKVERFCAALLHTIPPTHVGFAGHFYRFRTLLSKKS